MIELFESTLKAMDDYTKAVEMGFPMQYINRLDEKQKSLYEKIKSLGLLEEFEDYAMTF